MTPEEIIKKRYPFYDPDIYGKNIEINAEAAIELMQEYAEQYATQREAGENPNISDPRLLMPLNNDHTLVRWANKISGYYGHPVYLVGSQVTGINKPRDTDVVCAIPNDEFAIRYGNLNDWLDEGVTGDWTAVRWKWADDCVKRSLDGRVETNLTIDFKVQPMAQFKGLPSDMQYRLDTRPLTTKI